MRRVRRRLCPRFWPRIPFRRSLLDRREEYVRWIAEELIPEVAAARFGALLRCILRRSCIHGGGDAHGTYRCAAAWAEAARACGAVPAGDRSGVGCGTGRGDGGPLGDGDRRDTGRSCARRACSRCCCRVRCLRWDERTIRRRGRWSRWDWQLWWPRTSTPARHRLRRCRLFCRWRACRWDFLLRRRW